MQTSSPLPVAVVPAAVPAVAPVVPSPRLEGSSTVRAATRLFAQAGVLMGLTAALIVVITGLG